MDNELEINISQWTTAFMDLFVQSNSLFVALYAADGRLLFANPAMRSLFKGDPCRSLLNPTFAELWRAGAESSPVYRGFLTVGDDASINRSIPVRVYRQRDRLLILGDFDANQLNEQNEAMFRLNQEISTLQRQLIQEKRNLETALDQLNEANARLRELNATKDRFFSIIAHDLRSPFNAIVGLSNLMVEQIRQKDYDSIDQYAEIIEESSQQAMALLLNLLEWSRVQTGKIGFSPVMVELGREIDGAIAPAREAARQKEITIEREIPENAVAFADRPMLATVLRNLISNAIKFTWRGGRIVIAAHAQKDGWEIAVSDNGVGMSGETIAKLFRIDQSHTTPGTDNESGTGLGLILCREFITRHGGDIRVESEIDHGSRFIFSLPDPPRTAGA